MNAYPRTAPITHLKTWSKLASHADRLKDFSIQQALSDNPSRVNDFSYSLGNTRFDFSRHLIDQAALSDVIQIIEEAGLTAAKKQMFEGAVLNGTEAREVLHVALRTPKGGTLKVDGKNILDDIHTTLDRIESLVETVSSGELKGFTGKPIKHIVNVGIGGSFLGPKMVCHALKPFSTTGLTAHFVANVDAAELNEVIEAIEFDQALFVVASKTFTTLETITNAETCKRLLLESGCPEDMVKNHFVAVSTNIEAAKTFGILEENVFPMWDWVGGRYSLWSAIGLPIALTVGMEAFRELLNGAHEMDQHFLNTPAEQNIPVIAAALGLWYIHAYGSESQAVIPYDHFLAFLPGYLQQLDMESNGKSVMHTGQSTECSTGPVIWGDVGTNGQHAYHQLLHQGTRIIPCDFIASLIPNSTQGDHHMHLFSNCLSQMRALLVGRTESEAKTFLIKKGYSEEQASDLAPHLAIPGNRPSTFIEMEQLTPTSLGALIALYEHKVFVQGIAWNINSFDQWGVELGKQISSDITPGLQGQALADMDTPTLTSVANYRKHQN